MSESIVIPIVIDPKAGVAGLRVVGDEAKKTGDAMDKGAGSAGKFGLSMKNIASNAFVMLGAFNLAHHAIKLFADELIKAIFSNHKLASSTKMITDAQNEAIASTRKEVVELQALYAVAKDTALTYDKRQAAIDAMNKKYPELHNNLRLETIGNQEVADAIQNVINNLVKRAQADLLVKQLADLTNKLEALKAYGKTGVRVVDVTTSRMVRELEDRVSGLTQKVQELYKDTLPARKALGELFGEKVHTLKEIKIKPDKIKVEKPKVFEVADFNFEDAMMQALLKGKLKKKYSMFDNSASGDPLKGKDTTLEDMKKQEDDLIAKNEKLAQLMSGPLTSAADGFFDALLSRQNAIKAFFNSMIGAIKNVIKQLVAAVIEAGILSLLSGGVGKVGGFSFGGAFKKIMGFASGGIAFGPTPGVFGEGMGTNRYNPELVMPLDRLKDMLGNVFQMGRNVNSGSMGISGSLLSMPAYVEVRQRGRDMVGTLALENKSQGRTG